MSPLPHGEGGGAHSNHDKGVMRESETEREKGWGEGRGGDRRMGGEGERERY
jgi:hypothetical protein